MTRVAKALEEHAYGMEVVQAEHLADAVVLHVIGMANLEATIARCKDRGQQVILLQYCVRTTEEPSTSFWLPIWQNVACVWSYYDLPALCAEDGVDFVGVNFYHAPLGCDGDIFRSYDVPKKYAIATSGYVAETEGIAEAARATWALKVKQFHLGPSNLELGDHVVCKLDINDHDLAQFYSRCYYVAGLRRVEGFELPAVEGLLCGARPIVFDRPHYRQWFNDLAVFVPEGSPEDLVQALVRVMASQPQPVTAAERQVALNRFSWPAIAAGLWAAAFAPAKAPQSLGASVASSGPRRKVLVIGDAAVSSGFARATHRGILAETHKHWDVRVIGINYMGDPHDYPYAIYPPRDHTCHDPFGLTRAPKMAKEWQPDVIVIQQDPWNFPAYVKNLRKAEVTAPIVGAVAVDGLNCNAHALKDLDLAVFWTEFAKNEAVKAGYRGLGAVIPLGVDRSIYKSYSREFALRARGLPASLEQAFIVGNVNRNQPRKRLDLTVRYFAKFVQQTRADDAYLYLHIAPTGDTGYDVEQLMAFYAKEYHLPNLTKRLILADPEIGHGVHESVLAATYSLFDVQITTTQGEGWGLTTMEGMACGAPQIVPDWAALGEWPGDTVAKVRCTTTSVTPGNINVIGGVPDETEFVEALVWLYQHPHMRSVYRDRGARHVSNDRFNWDNIAKQWFGVLEEFMLARDMAQQSAESVAVGA